MVGNGGQQDHYLGGSGFDWAVYKDSPSGVIVFAELLFENEATALGANPSTLDRFQSIEGVSGSQHDDFLIGANQSRLVLCNVGRDRQRSHQLRSDHGPARSGRFVRSRRDVVHGRDSAGRRRQRHHQGRLGQRDHRRGRLAERPDRRLRAIDADACRSAARVFDSMAEFQARDLQGRSRLSHSSASCAKSATRCSMRTRNPPPALGYDTVSFDGNRADYLDRQPRRGQQRHGRRIPPTTSCASCA